MAYRKKRTEQVATYLARSRVGSYRGVKMRFYPGDSVTWVDGKPIRTQITKEIAQRQSLLRVHHCISKIE